MQQLIFVLLSHLTAQPQPLHAAACAHLQCQDVVNLGDPAVI
jgi:hypothetical protein